jgi:opacity protein-like surface antigen
MKKLTFLSVLLALFLIAAPNNAQAQDGFKVGPRVTIDLGDISDAFGGDFALGADVRVMIESLPVDGQASFDYYFAEDPWTVFAFDINALYPFAMEDQPFRPYVGAGLGIARWSADVESDFGFGFSTSNTDVGINLLGGAEFPLDGFTPFAQAQFTVGGDADRFGITGGVLFNL